MRGARITLALIYWVTLSPCAEAITSTIAVTGESAANVPGAIYDVVDVGSLSDNGHIAFTASLEVGVGGVLLGNSEGVWAGTFNNIDLLARQGSANVPDAIGSDYLSFYSASVDNDGNVLLRASMDIAPAGTTDGIWRYSTGSGSLIARTGSGGVPDLPGANYSTLPTIPSSHGNGNFAIKAQLNVGQGGVTGLSDNGLWGYFDDSPFLIAREGDAGSPGFNFANFGTPVVNGNQQSTWLATLDALPNNDDGIWRTTGNTLELLAQTGSGGVPGLPGSNFTGLRPNPKINDAGQVVITAEVDSSELGIWLYDESSSSLLFQQTTGGVPGIADAEVDVLDDPLLNNAGQVLVRAELVVGPGGVTSINSQGLWFLENGGSMVARTGSGGVPDIPGVNFASLDQYALNDQGQIAVAATLETGLGGVTTDNDTGLWLLDPAGTSQLIAREGDTLAGRTIAALDFQADARTGSGFNNKGQLLFQATFTSGDTGLFLFSSFTADFDGDSDVDGDDLADWQAAYRQTADGDANNDGLTTGADFLIWQEQYGSGLSIITQLTEAIPEPAPSTLLFVGYWMLLAARLRH